MELDGQIGIGYNFVSKIIEKRDRGDMVLRLVWQLGKLLIELEGTVNCPRALCNPLRFMK